MKLFDPKNRLVFESVYFKLLVAVILSIFFIELVLLGFSYFSKKKELNDLNQHIVEVVKENHGIVVKDPISKQYVELKLQKFVKNITLLVLLIIFSTSVAFLSAFYVLIGRHIIRLLDHIRAQNPVDLSLYPVDLIPDTEVGDIISSQNQLILKIERHLQEEKKLTSEVRKQQKINYHNAKLASIGRLAAGVGHEINNPLAIISGYVGLARLKIKEDQINADELEDLLGKIIVACTRVKNITVGLKNFSRLDGGEMSNFSLFEVIHETVQMLQGVGLSEVNIIEDLQITLERSYIYGSRGRIQQALLNLINNATDAVESVENPQISIILKEDCGKIVLEVQDNGCGISKQDQEKIFDAFFTTKDVNKGTGLGLAFVHSIINENNGEIQVESSPNKGARFVLSFNPMNMENIELLQKTDEKPYDVETDCLKTLKILLVDDEIEILDELQKGLSAYGANCRTARNSAVALELARNESFDFIITDIQMPDATGFKLVVESQGKLLSEKVIFLTGDVRNERDDFHSFPLVPGENLLLKPCDVRSLVEVLLSKKNANFQNRDAV